MSCGRNKAPHQQIITFIALVLKLCKSIYYIRVTSKSYSKQNWFDFSFVRDFDSLKRLLDLLIPSEAKKKAELAIDVRHSLLKNIEGDWKLVFDSFLLGENKFLIWSWLRITFERWSFCCCLANWRCCWWIDGETPGLCFFHFVRLNFLW